MTISEYDARDFIEALRLIADELDRANDPYDLAKTKDKVIEGLREQLEDARIGLANSWKQLADARTQLSAERDKAATVLQVCGKRDALMYTLQIRSVSRAPEGISIEVNLP